MERAVLAGCLRALWSGSLRRWIKVSSGTVCAMHHHFIISDFWFCNCATVALRHFYLSLVLPAVFCPAASLKRNYKDKTQDDLLWFTPYWIVMSPRVHSLQTVVCFVSQHSAVRAEGAHWHQHEQSVHWRDRPPEELWGPEAVSIVAETNHCNGDRSFTASISPAFMTNSRLGTSDPFCPLVVKNPQP